MRGVRIRIRGIRVCLVLLSDLRNKSGLIDLCRLRHWLILWGFRTVLIMVDAIWTSIGEG